MSVCPSTLSLSGVNFWTITDTAKVDDELWRKSCGKENRLRKIYNYFILSGFLVDLQYPQKEFAVSGGIFRFSACVLRRYDFFSNDWKVYPFERDRTRKNTHSTQNWMNFLIVSFSQFRIHRLRCYRASKWVTKEFAAGVYRRKTPVKIASA